MPASHRLAGREAIEVRELFDDPWIATDAADEVCRDFWLPAEHRGGMPATLGPSTRSLGKFMQLAVAGEVVGLAATWVQQALDRPGLAFVPVTDVAPVCHHAGLAARRAQPKHRRVRRGSRELSPPAPDVTVHAASPGSWWAGGGHETCCWRLMDLECR